MKLVRHDVAVGLMGAKSAGDGIDKGDDVKELIDFWNIEEFRVDFYDWGAVLKIRNLPSKIIPKTPKKFDFLG